MLAHLAQQALGVGPDVGAFSLHGEQHFPGLNDECLLFGQIEVGGWCHFYEAKLSDDVEACEVEGQELVDVVSVLQQWF